MLPLLQVGQHDFAVAGDVLSPEDHHLTCGSDVADGGRQGVGFFKPHAHWDVVGLVLCEKTEGENVFFVSYVLSFIYSYSG